jgi:uncharacterized membrane protein
LKVHSWLNRVWQRLQDQLGWSHVAGYLFTAALFGAVLLAFIMALVSDFNSHPDEFIHFKAVEYYSDGNWLPPVIGDPETLDTYSIYGHSRLNLPGGFYYLLAGKFTTILKPFISDAYMAARLFNVSMFLLLVLLALKTPTNQRLLFGVLLLTPQVWYIFSYVNSDAFALFLSILVTIQLVNENSYFRTYLKSPGALADVQKLALPVVLVGMLYYAKDNYYIYLLFLVIWAGWFLYSSTDRRQVILKFLVVGLLLVLFYGAVQGVDYYVHGPDKAKNLSILREAVAGEEFKAAARASGESYYGLNLRYKGVGYVDLFKTFSWHKLTFYSFVGVYGYMTLFGSLFYYRLMGFLLLAFIFLVFSDLWSSSREAKFFIIIAALLTGLIVYISSYHSWVKDFQAQGRYLFPVLGIYAYLFGRYYGDDEKRLLLMVLMIIIALVSAYSFIFYGLANIPKL